LFRVHPLYQQVEVSDDADVDRPRWEGEEERLVYSPQCIVLATRDDLQGAVEIEVRIGGDGVGELPGHLLFDGELQTTGHGILVGNPLTELHRVALPIGWHPVRIYGDRPALPARFLVVLDGGRGDV
jgi:hypothetical protein